MAEQITPVILCGGSGTRLWPLSRKSYPKQFVELVGEGSLFQQSAQRLSGPEFADPVIVTNSDFRFTVTQQLSEAGINPGAVLIEPEARNTAPALLAAALRVAQDDPDGLILAAPSDHYITQAETFRATVMRGAAAARAGQIVTFGILPTRPETGYGYLELSDGTGNAVPLKRFVEKPDLPRAEAMLAEEKRALQRDRSQLKAERQAMQQQHLIERRKIEEERVAQKQEIAHDKELLSRRAERLDDREAALERLTQMGRTYACTCSRKEIAQAASAPHAAGLRYPGTCREGARARPGRTPSIRLKTFSVMLGGLP